MANQSPGVFLSSTCYDLKQIRTDIRDFFELQLGFNTILSEYDSFPVDPNVTAIDNCLKNVKERADIFVLVIGGRYGYVTDKGKSVTNLEYLAAKSKGIPIYIFIDKSILSILAMWKSNPSADYSSIVDSTKLFEFICQLRETDNNWTFGFENANDIILTLRKQISYLFYSSIALQTRLQKQTKSRKIFQLTGESLKYALERPSGWEYLLLGTLMRQKILGAEDIRKDMQYNVVVGEVRVLDDPPEVTRWIGLMTHKLIRVIDSLTSLFNNAVEPAIGKPGEPGDIDNIIYLAERFGSIYEELIKYGHEFKLVKVDEVWDSTIKALSVIVESPINDVLEFDKKWEEVIGRIKSKSAGEALEIDLVLSITTLNMSDFNREFCNVQRHFGIL